MQIISFNDYDTPVSFHEDSRQVRIAYLLGNKVALAGNYRTRLTNRKNGITARQIMATVPLNDRIKTVRKYFKNFGLPLDIDLDYLKKLGENFTKTKNKSSLDIAVFKKFERVFDTIYYGIIDWTEEQIKLSGYFELAELFDEQIVQCYSFSWFNPEKPSRNEFKASSILNLDFELGNKSKIFLLTEYFFESPFADSFKYVNVDHEDASLEQMVYLEPLLKIPDLNSLKAAEMMVIRKSLDKIRQQFCEKADEWINMCHSGKSFDERKQILQRDILPMAKEIGKLIDKHPNIQHVKMVADEDRTMEVFIGEIPFQLLLDYYWHYKIIKKETLDKIEKLQENHERFNKRWPILVAKLVNGNKANNNNFSINELFKPSTKKTISID